ncbi:MAG TPA: TolC family outer membrane protein [Allosphingosinicella sp.]|nr:TolC family outer membrane protein [Allosphingosinicella sp.]
MRGRMLAAVAMIAMSGGAFAQVGTVPRPEGGVLPPAGPTQDLRGALGQTYQTNPTLMAQRQSLRATDETVALARAEGRPQVDTSAGFNQDVVTRNLGSNQRDFSASATVSMPLYAGGRIRNSVRAANTRVEAGRADLRATEGDVFTEAVAAYMDVIRDRSIRQLNQNQVRVLETNLQATRDRFEVGDLTRTDVAQSEARLSLSRSNLAVAEGRLQASEENYRRVIGQLPPDLQPPPPLPTLPADIDTATSTALADNPDLQSIAARARAAGFDVRVARGFRLPTVTASGVARHFDFLGTANNGTGGLGIIPDSNTSTGFGLTMSLPLYQGGGASARVRQAQALRGQLLEQAIGVERSVISNVRAAYATYVAASQAIDSQTIAVAANQLALEGTRAEQTVGTRNILDVLNAEQELLNSQVLLVTARREAYVAGFQLLNVMGMAEAQDLNLDAGPLYDPTINYDRYADSWSDWNDGPRIAPVSTRTAPVGAQSPVTQLPQ